MGRRRRKRGGNFLKEISAIAKNGIDFGKVKEFAKEHKVVSRALGYLAKHTAIDTDKPKRERRPQSALHNALVSWTNTAMSHGYGRRHARHHGSGMYQEPHQIAVPRF